MSPRGWAILVSVPAAAAIAGFGYFLFAQPVDPPQVSTAVGRALYLANCGGCHGVDLEGQPNWMKRKEDGRLPAPPHDETGHTWHHSDQQLFAITKFGLQSIAPGYETDMPAFENVLADSEIVSILDYIKSTWPERARSYQADRTKADGPD
jgi:mono/diheme cytochrome c family protein